MKPTTISILALAVALPATAQTTIMDAATNNGSFETIDPHTAPISNTTRRASNSGAAFLVGSNSTLIQGAWEITGSGFHGVDSTTTGPGPQDGTELALANHSAVTNGLSGAIPLVIAENDTFDLSCHTMGNTIGGVFDYSISLRFDEDPGTDVEILAGTHTTADPIDWVERIAATYTYPSITNANSVQVLFTMDNTTGGATDQVYLDNITLTTSATGLDPAGDEDNDNITNGDELSGALNPYDAAGNYVGAGMGGAPTNPTNPDSDGDFLDDDVEISPTLGGGFETNPNSQDTDTDGLFDDEEINGTAGFFTDPTYFDTDGDNLPDKWEIDNSLDPTDDGTNDEVNGENGDPDGDQWFNGDEFFSGTDPQEPDTDFDTVNDGQEDTDGTDPLDPDTDHDGFEDGVEKTAGTDPLEKDSDFDTFSDYAEITIFGTDPTLDSSVPTPAILIDAMTRNGSFEDTTGGTNPSGSGDGTTRFAANGAGQLATLPDWSAIWIGGFVGFDSQTGADDGSFYGFVNDGSHAAFQSSTITQAIPAGQLFHIQLNTTNNNAGGSSTYNVGLIFDGGAPVAVGTVDHDEDKADEYYERNLTYQATQAASSVALVIESDNTNGGNDQPRFDLVRLYSEAGTLPSALVIADISKSGDNLTVEFTSDPGATYTLFFSDDIVGGFGTELDNNIPAHATDPTTTYTIDLSTVLAPVPDSGFVRVSKN